MSQYSVLSGEKSWIMAAHNSAIAERAREFAGPELCCLLSQLGMQRHELAVPPAEVAHQSAR